MDSFYPITGIQLGNKYPLGDQGVLRFFSCKGGSTVTQRGLQPEEGQDILGCREDDDSREHPFDRLWRYVVFAAGTKIDTSHSP